MSRLLVIGCGGVAQVAIQKCCQNDEVFTELCIASRTKSKCDALKEKIEQDGYSKTKLSTAQVNADNVQELVALIKSYKPDCVLNVALPYQDLTIMDACLECGVHYIDTANYEPEDTNDPEWRKIYDERCKKLGFSAYFDYSWQWAYDERFKKANLTALLGTGFDPGVTSVFVAYAKKHYFDTIDEVDILDCNGGDHGYPFATNFNPEINLREVSAPGSYWEDGHWVEIPAMSIKREYDFPCVGKKDMYLLHHEEIEALGRNFPEIKRIRFFMTFGQSYLTHMKCLENVGMLGTEPVMHNGVPIVPIQFLKTLLPDPATLGPRTVGKTNIGCIFRGKKDGKERTIYIYNVCDHQECYKELGSQAISYTTGVPAMIGTALVASGVWNGRGAKTTDEFDPDPYMDMLNKFGLPWVVVENPVLVD
ncbi:MAG: saccharopine dehydrogenase family protein [Synergistaceae bacterium]|nr:saccharopine dehydrogenase family protein [Synergistaceae bacterium]